LEIVDGVNPIYFSVFDKIGRNIVLNQPARNISAEEISNLKRNGAFVIKVESTTCFNTFKL